MIFGQDGIVGGIKNVIQKKSGVSFDDSYKDTLSSYGNALSQGTDKSLAKDEFLSEVPSYIAEIADKYDVAAMGSEKLDEEVKERIITHQAEDHSLSSVRSLLNEYNKGTDDCALGQKKFTNAVGKGNTVLAAYLKTLKEGEKATMPGFLAFSAKGALQAAATGIAIANATKAVSDIVSLTSKIYKSFKKKNV